MVDKTAGTLFQAWLRREIEPWLAGRGWARRGLIFEHARGPNTALIQLVRWKGSTAAHYDFWVEAAIYSPRVADELALFFESPPPAGPDIGFAAANVRLAALLGERTDVVWRLRADALGVQQESLGHSVRESLERHILPWIDGHASDEQLRDELIDRGERAGIQSLRELRRLVADLGPAEDLSWVDGLIAR